MRHDDQFPRLPPAVLDRSQQLCIQFVGHIKVIFWQTPCCFGIRVKRLAQRCHFHVQLFAAQRHDGEVRLAAGRYGPDQRPFAPRVDRNQGFVRVKQFLYGGDAYRFGCQQPRIVRKALFNFSQNCGLITTQACQHGAHFGNNRVLLCHPPSCQQIADGFGQRGDFALQVLFASSQRRQRRVADAGA